MFTLIFLAFNSRNGKGANTIAPIRKRTKFICNGRIWGTSFEATSKDPNITPVNAMKR